jgi:AcrR family transcriptional regulator
LHGVKILLNTLETILVFKVSVVHLYLQVKQKSFVKEKIIQIATDMFLKIGFKTVTMDDIANEMGISKKTIYKYFANKELLIEEGTDKVQNEIKSSIDAIIAQNKNAIEENFEIRKMFQEMFGNLDTSPVYQLKKHYPEIHSKTLNRQFEECMEMFSENIKKGISEKLYRNDIKIDTCVKFYFGILMNINEKNISEKDIQQLEFEAMEYHIRAIATEKGLLELEKQLKYTNN